MQGQRIRSNWFLVVLAVSMIINWSCYSFRGISIDPTIETFYVGNFDVIPDNAPPALGINMAEALKDKTRNESRLQLTDTDPDIEFIGKVTRYQVSPQAPGPDETVGFNRLNITVEIEYINEKDPDAGWKRNFPFFSDFSIDQDLISIQDDLIETITDQLVEDIFNRAFTNW